MVRYIMDVMGMIKSANSIALYQSCDILFCALTMTLSKNAIKPTIISSFWIATSARASQKECRLLVY